MNQKKAPLPPAPSCKNSFKKKNSNDQDIKLENSTLIDVSGKFCL